MRDITKKCTYCQKEFVITSDQQQQALEKGGKVKRKYCFDCLLKEKC